MEGAADFSNWGEDKTYTPEKDESWMRFASAALIGLNSFYERRVFPMTKARVRIGRKKPADLVLEDGSVSGHHADIVKITYDYFVEDVGSRNGTRVNGELITERTPIQNTDLLTIGPYTFMFRCI